MAITLGLNCKLFYKTGGVGGGGTYTELTDVMDVKINVEANESDVTTRANGGWEATVATLLKGELTFDMIWDHTNAGMTAIRTAFFSKAILGIKALDGDATTGEGLVADMQVFKFDVDQPLKDAAKVSVTLKPTYSATAPSWQAGT